MGVIPFDVDRAVASIGKGFGAVITFVGEKTKVDDSDVGLKDFVRFKRFLAVRTG